MKDYYYILGVKRTANQDEIKAAFRKLANKLHPDKNGGDAYFTNLFKDINEAYEVLSDSTKKAQYDRRIANKPVDTPNNQGTEKSSKPNKDSTKVIFEFKSSSYDVSEGDIITLKWNLIGFYEIELLGIGKSLPNSGESSIRIQGIKGKKEVEIRCIARELSSKELVFKKVILKNKSYKSDYISILSWLRFVYVAFFEKILGFLVLAAIIAVIGGITSVFSDKNTDKSPTTEKKVEQTMAPKKLPNFSFPAVERRDSLFKAGWTRESLNNGPLPSCFKFSTKKGNINNYLDVSVGKNTSVVIKVISRTTNNCVRCVYISAGTKYRISKIPEDQYFLKIAYGNFWISKLEGKKCRGMFLNDAQFKESTSDLDFNKVSTANGFSIPYFTLTLDLVRTSENNIFHSNSISEAEFNN